MRVRPCSNDLSVIAMHACVYSNFWSDCGVGWIEPKDLFHSVKTAELRKHVFGSRQVELYKTHYDLMSDKQVDCCHV